MKVLFLTPYSFKNAPSQRFRFEQYFSLLDQQHIEYKLHEFASNTSWQTLQKPGRPFRKVIILTAGIIRRLCSLFSAVYYDFVFIHREVAPIGPPIIEWTLAMLFRKKIIYDFDDAIWTTDKASESFLERMLRARYKVPLLCKWSYKVSCGNWYLCQYASKFNSSVVLNPTTIDTEHLHNPELYNTTKNNNEIVLGWTGSYSTLKYLYALEPILSWLEKKYTNLKIIIIADAKPEIKLTSVQYVPWSMETEIEDLLKFDIGIMPLPDDEWSKGKCGFKALQYMALGIPPVISPIGVNSEIVSHGEDGFLCSTQQEWRATLELLIQNPALRNDIGEKARLKVLRHYSVSSNSSNFLSLFL